MAPGPLSRRAWLAVAGSTLLAAASAAVWRSGVPGVGSGAAATVAPATYVDYEGWILAPIDKQRLVQERQAMVPSQ